LVVLAKGEQSRPFVEQFDEQCQAVGLHFEVAGAHST